MNDKVQSWVYKLGTAILGGVVAVPTIMEFVPKEYQPLAMFGLFVLGSALGINATPPGSVVVPAAMMGAAIQAVTKTAADQAIKDHVAEQHN